MNPRPAKLTYNGQRILEDAAARGWLPVDLARAAGVSHTTVNRFIRGDGQTARTAEKLARALGRSAGDYLRRAA